jgi:DNA invertase Pin-like site-specific DNA recombinase
MQVVTYCRVSSEEQAAKDLSIPAQKKMLIRWAEERPEVNIVGSFVDEGQSAYAPADKRPGFCEMVSFCRKSKVDAILVHKLDRFSRNREESILFKSLLRKHGVQIKSITENFDADTPQGFLYEGMIEVINQFYSMNLATETLKGMKENAERGYVNGGCVPFGYRLERKTDGKGREHGHLVLGPDSEVQLVQRIFQMAATEGLGVKSIANTLNTEGIRAPRSPHWTGSSVHTLLNNRAYLGHLVWFKSRKQGRDRRQPTEEGERIVVENAHPAIIDAEMFDRRAAIASTRRFDAHKSPSRHASWLLARLIKCDHCGANYGGRRYYQRNAKKGTQIERFAYYCGSYMSKGKSVCPPLPIQRDWIEGVVLGIIKARVAEPDGLAELEQMVRSKIDAQRRAIGSDSRSVEGKLADIDRRIQNFVRAIGDGLDPAVCKAQIAELNAQKEQVEREASLLRREDHYRKAIERNLAELRRLSEVLKDRFDGMHAQARREVILHFIEKIEVKDRQTIEIHFKVPFNSAGVKHLVDEVASPGGRGGGSGEWGSGGQGGGAANLQSEMARGANPRAARTSQSRQAPWWSRVTVHALLVGREPPREPREPRRWASLHRRWGRAPSAPPAPRAPRRGCHRTGPPRCAPGRRAPRPQAHAAAPAARRG